MQFSIVKLLQYQNIINAYENCNVKPRKNFCYEFWPCEHFDDIPLAQTRAFLYCYKYIHKLPYYPQNDDLQCKDAKTMLMKFITDNNIKLIYYKGGCVEKKLCEEIGIESKNLEDFYIPKAQCHDPKEETHFYHFVMQTHIFENLNDNKKWKTRVFILFFH